MRKVLLDAFFEEIGNLILFSGLKEKKNLI
jgi:hypothetical protein